MSAFCSGQDEGFPGQLCAARPGGRLLRFHVDAGSAQSSQELSVIFVRKPIHDALRHLFFADVGNYPDSSLLVAFPISFSVPK